MEKGDNRGYVLSLEVEKPSLENNTADAERVKEALGRRLADDATVRIPFRLLNRLPSLLRQSDHAIRAVVFRDSQGWVLVEAADAHSENRFLGVAADIGTTRVVLRLVDLESNRTLSQKAFDNPQDAVGPDILTRIHHAKDPENASALQSLLIEKMNAVIEGMCRDAGCTTQAVYLFCGAGNTGMTHLFLGLDVSCIIREPYTPCVNSPELIEAERLGLGMNPGGQVYLFPDIGSYFGGDVIAGIFYSGIYKSEFPCVMVDVGTNAEVVVGCRDWLIGCAGAAGPALEGGVSDIGMTARPGVIDRVAVNSETGGLIFHTMDDMKALGICGSGMIDLVSALFMTGRIDIRGKFVKERCGDALFEKDGITRFVLVGKEQSGTGEDICISQVDVDLLTSSKAAMYTILEVIVANTAGLRFDDLAFFYVAGTFGSFIDPESAIAIGMLPDIDRDRFSVLGNSSLEGATEFLTRRDSVVDVIKIRENITYMELNVNQTFMNMFSGAKFYPHTDRSKFPSVQ